MKFTSDNTENYNSEFLLSELTDALSKAHDTSPGPDDIHYQLLKHLPVSTLLILFEICNDIWNKIQKLSSFKSNENIHKREDGSYYVVSPGFSSRLERGPGAQFSLGTSLTWWAVFVPTGKS